MLKLRDKQLICLLRSLALRYVEHNAKDRDRLAILEADPRARRNPAFDPVGYSNDPVLKIADDTPIRSDTPPDRVTDTLPDRLFCAREVVRVHAGPPHLVGDRCTGREAPHRPHRIIPLKLVGSQVQAVTAEFR